MKVWIDLANSPHVPLFVPIAATLRARAHDVVFTCRDHAQTLALARDAWPDVQVVGGPSPRGRVAKTRTIVKRAAALHRVGRRERFDVALSHGSYAQIVAAWAARIPAVTMMDYEHQPANHFSFRLASRVIVPAVFPDEALRRYGAGKGKVVRYDGFKEDLYLSGGNDDGFVRAQLGIRPATILAVVRPPPDGALYHRAENDRFDEVLAWLEQRRDVAIVLLPRSHEQEERYSARRVRIPERPLDGQALLATADFVIGGGGTMTREAALLGTPSYTVFMPQLGAVDVELMRLGRIGDLRERGRVPVVEKKRQPSRAVAMKRGDALRAKVVAAVEEVVNAGR
jgi:predicted glycosyltransferase